MLGTMSSLAQHYANLRQVAALSAPEMDLGMKLRMVSVLGLVLGSAALMAASPVLLKFTVDAFTVADAGAMGLTPLGCIVLYVLSQWLAKALVEARSFLYAKIDRRMYRSIGSRVFEHVMRLPLRFHLDRQTGGFSQTLSNGLQGYQAILQQVLFTLLPALIELVGVAVILLHFGHVNFLLIFSGALLFYAAAFLHGIVRVAGPARAVSNAHINANAVLTDSILNYEAIKYFNAEATAKQRFDASLLHTEREWLRFFRLRTRNGLAVATIFAGFLAVTLLYAGWQTQHHLMTTGDFVLVSAYLFQLVRPVEALGTAFQQITQGFAFIEALLALFREKKEEALPAARGLAGPGRLEFEQVSFAYSGAQATLKNISFHLPAGHTLGIVGASGAGKSSLVRLLVRLLEPSAGAILLDGVRLSELSTQALRQSIAVVPQESMLFNDTIGFNIALGKPDCTQQEVEEAAKLAHLHAFIMSLPERYETRVGERGIKLSGGEKQRISIARAAIKRPLLYIFDEATSSLDSRTEQDILHSIRSISRQCTTLIIAHRLSTVVHCDQIIVLHQGAITERGSHLQLLALGGHYARLWEAQQRSSVVALEVSAGGG